MLLPAVEPRGHFEGLGPWVASAAGVASSALSLPDTASVTSLFLVSFVSIVSSPGRRALAPALASAPFSRASLFLPYPVNPHCCRAPTSSRQLLKEHPFSSSGIGTCVSSGAQVFRCTQTTEMGLWSSLSWEPRPL